MQDYQVIINFWFGEFAAQGEVALQWQQRWWLKDPGFDSLVQQQFGATIEQAASGDYQHWLTTAAGSLALIIVCDQLPRNAYRGTARAFAYDHLARSWASQALAQGFDAQLYPIQRLFMYLPFEHAEDLELQNKSVALFAELQQQVAPQEKQQFSQWLDYAKRHQDVIARFGRFPHRNAILSRTSSSDELQYLSQAGAGF